MKKKAAEKEAIRVFAANLRDLLLAAPAGPRVTVGLDPGLRTGVKSSPSALESCIVIERMLPTDRTKLIESSHLRFLA